MFIIQISHKKKILYRVPQKDLFSNLKNYQVNGIRLLFLYIKSCVAHIIAVSDSCKVPTDV